MKCQQGQKIRKGKPYLANQVRRLARDMRWDLETDRRDLAIRSCMSHQCHVPHTKKSKRTSLPAEILKRRLADQKLKHEHSERPVIDFLGVRTAFNHFRREVVECTAKGCSAACQSMSDMSALGCEGWCDSGRGTVYENGRGGV